MMIFAPFYADDLSQDIPFIVLSSVVVIVVAALTNPLKRSIMSADTIVSAIGLIVFESWALINFQTQSPILFVLRELLALLYMAALYFSLKTLRSMVQGNIGQRVNPENIDVDSADFQDRAREVLEEINEEEKTNFTD